MTVKVSLVPAINAEPPEAILLDTPTLYVVVAPSGVLAGLLLDNNAPPSPVFIALPPRSYN